MKSARYEKSHLKLLSSEIQIGSAEQVTRQPSISFIIGNYRHIIVRFADSELWLTWCDDWLRSIFYCYSLSINSTPSDKNERNCLLFKGL